MTTNLPQFVTDLIDTYGRAQDRLGTIRHGFNHAVSNVAEARALLEAAIERYAQERLGGRKCMASYMSDPPRDCDAPFCGCDPAWLDCIKMLNESGWDDCLASNARIAALESQLAELTKRLSWRKVSEGLPPAHEAVLCNFGDEECHVLAYSPGEWKWYRQMDDKEWGAPTHWREIGPLPDTQECK